MSELVANTPLPNTAGDGHASFWSRLDAYCERVGDRLNPILVKEARQALKSRQFTVTFSLMLICGWIWSVISVGWNADGLLTGRAAQMLFGGYFVILVIPSMVMAPLAAFQSLAAERNEGTFELLWITSLSARQIVRGKLASAVLQLMVYFSALAPCLAFTYLLRGLDILTISLVVGYTFVFALLGCCLALLLATLTRATQMHVLLSALLVIAVGGGAWIWLFIALEAFLVEGAPLDQPDFWFGNLACVTGLVSFMVLFLAAAAAQMSFAADNHSTRLRVIMLGQQTLFIGWIMFFGPPADVIPYFFPVAGLYWAVTGALMTGELAELSPRAKRALPQTALGRVLFTWFNPGSGTGYVFATTNLAVGLSSLVVFAWGARPDSGALFHLMSVALVVWGYVALYLGLGRLLILVLRPRMRFGPMVGFAVQAVVATFAVIGPMTLQFSLYRIFGEEYTLVQLPNWGWSTGELIRYGIGAVNSNLNVVEIVVPLVGSLLFLANLGAAAREVAQTRAATPQRVLEDRYVAGVPVLGERE